MNSVVYEVIKKRQKGAKICPEGDLNPHDFSLEPEARFDHFSTYRHMSLVIILSILNQSRCFREYHSVLGICGTFVAHFFVLLK